MNELENQFELLEPSLKRLEEEARFALKESIHHSHIKIHSVLSRVKSLESIQEKTIRKNLSNPLETMDDLVGVRVVCLFRSDLKTLAEIVHKEFDVTAEDNKLDGATVDVFGYQSVHFIAHIKASHKGPRYQGLHALRVEIQLRTVAMDTWATLSHYLDYKTEPDVPRELRKDFFALSGLFYVADSHFELFYEARQRASTYAKKEATSSPSIDQELNLDSLRAYLTKRYPDRRHLKLSDVSELLSELSQSGYASLGQLHLALEKSADAFTKYESKHPPSGGRFADMGVVRISLAMADPNYSRFQQDDVLLSFRKHLK